MFRKIVERQFVRFCMVGGFNTILDFAVLNSLVYLVGLPILIANSMSVLLGVSLSYVLNSKFVFRPHHVINWVSYFKFIAITGVSVILIQSLVIAASNPLYAQLTQASAHIAHFSENEQHQIALNLAKATAVGVGLFWNYLLYSKLVFSKKTDLMGPIDPEA